MLPDHEVSPRPRTQRPDPPGQVERLGRYRGGSLQNRQRRQTDAVQELELPGQVAMRVKGRSRIGPGSDPHARLVRGRRVFPVLRGDRFGLFGHPRGQCIFTRKNAVGRG